MKKISILSILLIVLISIGYSQGEVTTNSIKIKVNTKVYEDSVLNNNKLVDDENSIVDTASVVTNNDNQVSNSDVVEPKEQEMNEEIVIYFDKIGQVNPNETDNNKIKTQLSGKEIVSIKISGYTDAVGSETVNNKISQKRISQVQNILKNMGISETLINTENNGEKYATQDENSKKYGNKNDRKVVIKFTYNK